MVAVTEKSEVIGTFNKSGFGRRNEQAPKTPFSQRAVVRVGFLLLCVLVIFAFVRQLMIPESFGEYGRYRGASVGEVAGRDINFAGGGNKNCESCHPGNVQALAQGEHKSLDCQSCHGPAAKHLKNPAARDLAVKGDAELCGACHRDIAGRSKERIATVKLQMHSGGVECARCHDPHQPWAKLGGKRP